MGNRLICGNDKAYDHIRSEPLETLFWIGLIEVLPLITGSLFTGYFKHLLFPFDYLVMGLIVSIILAYIVRKDIPHLPVSLQTQKKEKVHQL